MTTYYVDAGSASEASPYDTWAKAAHKLETVLAIPPAAGDIIYCNANTGETITTKLSMASSGTYDGGYIKIVGVKPNGATGVTNDGTRYAINGGGNNISIIDLAGYDLWWLENIKVYNTGSTGSLYGIYTSANGSAGCVFINCSATQCQTAGFYAQYITNPFWCRCASYSNTGHGFARISQSGGVALGCSAKDNSSDGFSDIVYGSLIGCLSINNGDDGIDVASSGYNSQLLMNCVVHGNTDDGIYLGQRTDAALPLIVIGCRVTGHSGSGDIGLNSNSRICVYGWNYFDGNADDIANETIAQALTEQLSGSWDTDSNLNSETQDDDDYGYTDSSTDNYATKYISATDPLLRRKAITVPLS